MQKRNLLAVSWIINFSRVPLLPSDIQSTKPKHALIHVFISHQKVEFIQKKVSRWYLILCFWDQNFVCAISNFALHLGLVPDLSKLISSDPMQIIGNFLDKNTYMEFLNVVWHVKFHKAILDLQEPWGPSCKLQRFLNANTNWGSTIPYPHMSM